MKVLVVGANGQVGKHLVEKIQNSESIQAKAMIRKAEQAKYFEDLGAETVLVDLEDETSKITEAAKGVDAVRSEEHTSELQSRGHLVCRLLLEKKKKYTKSTDKTERE